MVFEGGANRTVFSCGVMTAMMITGMCAADVSAAEKKTGEMAPADATFCGSLFFFAHAAETVSDATTDAATEMVTAAGSSLSFCSFAAA